jgi:hypothetical protein
MSKQQSAPPLAPLRLYKLGNGFMGRAWYKRYVIIQNQMLVYWTKVGDFEARVKPHKTVLLAGCRVEDTGIERWSGKARLPAAAAVVVARREVGVERF